jgi:replication fork protection complex subunit Tof1/Swi1
MGVAFFSSILKDIRMERSKIRDADNLRALFVSRFFIEYFLSLRTKEDAERKARIAATEAQRKEVIAARDRLWEEAEPAAETEQLSPLDEVAAWGMSFALVAEVLEDNPVRWVASRMKMTMEDNVRQLLSCPALN